MSRAVLLRSPLRTASLGTVLLLAALIATATPAFSQDCNFSITDLQFGSVDPLDGDAVDATATVTANCTGVGALGVVNVRICPSIGAGSGGADSTARYLVNGSSRLAFQLYTNSTRTSVWGSNYWSYGGTVPNFIVPMRGVVGSSGSISFPIYGRVFGGQSDVASQGSYTSNFTAADNFFDYGYNTVLLSCLNIPVVGQQENPTFTARANISHDCSVTAEDLHFGTHGLLSHQIQAQGAVEARCTVGTPYTIALGNGQNGNGPTNRKMSSGSAAITYGIYRDAARTQPWGSGGANQLSATGSGATQRFPTYGLVPAQTTPGSGTYTDNVIVTLTY